jgi:type III secretion system PrgH/EprH family protein
MPDIPPASLVLRLFNGPLAGCEFALRQPRTLFLVGPPATFCAGASLPSVPADAIYVPLDAGGCNFEVLLADAAGGACRLRHWGEAGTARAVDLQSMISVGALKVALRTADEPWSEALLQPPAAAEAICAPAVSSRWIPGIATFAALVSVAAVLHFGAWQALQPDPVADVRALLGGAAGVLQVLGGDAHEVHVLAATSRDASWARQALQRSGLDASGVIEAHVERARLQRLLNQHFPHLAYHRIDFSDGAVPELWVSAQRNDLTAELRAELEVLLLAHVPYARAVHIRTTDDQVLVAAAEQGLARLAIPFQRLDKPGAVTFTVQGSLQDGELLAVRDYVNEYYRLWGDRYVHFAIELKDDQLQGRSFRYGPQGYVKMAPSSWHFPQSL